ncbi:MAG: cobalamin B12-binding domain-containing protein [Actinobacteria bacterium]|nr:cobalamin B12-binding domain-containing protein [Actinomycetota bacterium]
MASGEGVGDRDRAGHRDRPWIFRTYAGYGNPRVTNARYRTNLAKGQTGLSIAFDLPTQTGYDSDHPMARGEVGRVGVPVCHLGDLRTVLDGIPVADMNTSMTINATALWLFALYVAVADEQGADRRALAATTQNDILKEFLARGTYVLPPEPSMRLTADLVTWAARETPRWNPINVCSYHLQEAGATPVEEVAFTLANACAVLDHVRATGRVPEGDLPALVGRISFFCNAGIRFVEETAKMRAFTLLWDRLTRERYGVEDPKLRRFRYGVQVNSLGLYALQPENNVYRILLEMLAVTLSRDARARAVQLPAWNEALGLPRAWDQQWSLRAQQILALETDLLEHPDLFEGSVAMGELTDRIAAEAWDELGRLMDMGGSVEALGYMKERLVASHARRLRELETGERVAVGVNRLTETEPSPLVEGPGEGSERFAVDVADPADEAEQLDGLAAWRASRDARAAATALDDLRRAADAGEELVDVSIEAARAGVTTGEWAGALREAFGEYRAPTGVSDRALGGGDRRSLDEVRRRVAAAADRLGVRRLRMLVGKPGLDGHSNAAEQVAVRARDAGIEVVYQGIRLSPEEIARAAVDEDVHVIGLSILSGAHNLLVPEVLRSLAAEGVDPARVPVVVGGVIPEEDAAKLREAGVARVFTPREHDLTSMIGEVADLVGRSP